ncbi:hypothetical protein LPE509_00735 [Legionella pneumophila subsp. pneumophila LPE509]|nr:hypothetical protein LPE509_00735 [Legionella pneumophila subsp. pneumophila LPE509]
MILAIQKKGLPYQYSSTGPSLKVVYKNIKAKYFAKWINNFYYD